MTTADDQPPLDRVTSNGVTLAVRRLGPRSGTPRIVLVHGGPGLDHHLLLPLGRYLAAELPDAEVWLPDLPGHGASRVPDRGLPDLDTVVQRTGRWLSGLEASPTVLVGHSLGAWLVRQWLSGETLEASVAVFVSPAVARTVDSLKRPPVHRLQRGSVGRREARLRSTLLELMVEDLDDFDARPSPETTAAVGRARLVPPGDYRALCAQLERALAGPIPVLRSSPGQELLFLVGERDTVAPPERVEELAAATPGSRVRALEDAGHYPFAVDVSPVGDPIVEAARRMTK